MQTKRSRSASGTAGLAARARTRSLNASWDNSRSIIRSAGTMAARAMAFPFCFSLPMRFFLTIASVDDGPVTAAATARVRTIRAAPEASLSPQRLPCPSMSVASAPPEPLLQFDQVVYRTRDGHTVLDGASFAVQRGEFVVLRGASGAGKTTVLRLLAAAVRPTAGRVSVGGRDISRLQARASCRRCAASWGSSNRTRAG